MKQKHNGGYSLIEVLVAIVLLGIFVAPTCSSLVMGYRMNSKADQLMQAQLAVSSAVETLMAEGIDKDEHGTGATLDRFENVTVTTVLDSSGSFYKVTVQSDIEASVVVTTYIREEGGNG
ncbi:MAG: prepilin-type N-terminal cleavage/methylation domain-containing protein [Oscillospiraceae bacterium]|nr:prepilin-type N-terminal cleavage/methylation domain-containing protein [Oscillospiraceae bacterium]